MDPRGGRDVLERLKISCLCRKSTPDRPALILLTKPTLAQDVFDVADNTRILHYRRYFLDTLNKTGDLCELCLK